LNADNGLPSTRAAARSRLVSGKPPGWPGRTRTSDLRVRRAARLSTELRGLAWRNLGSNQGCPKATVLQTAERSVAHFRRGGRRDSNPGPAACDAAALPTELIAHAPTERIELPFPWSVARRSIRWAMRLGELSDLCASASNGARHACPVRPPKCAGRESNPHALRHGHLRPAWLPVTPPARGADDGLRTRDLRHGEATLCLLSYIHSEPPRGIEPRTSFVPGTRSCQLSYGGMSYRSEPPTGVEPATLGTQDRCSGQLSYRGGAGTRRGAEGAEIRPASRTVACLEPLTRIERVPLPYESSALDLLSYKGIAGTPGFEPGSSRIRVGWVCLFPYVPSRVRAPPGT
jgi:hypothetical protein